MSRRLPARPVLRDNVELHRSGMHPTPPSLLCTPASHPSFTKCTGHRYVDADIHNRHSKGDDEVFKSITEEQ